MKIRPSLQTTFSACLLALLHGTVAHGQAIAAEFGSHSLDHFLVADPLYGGAARLSYPTPSARVKWELEFARFTGDAARTGIPCAGLINPETCHLEALRDRTRLWTVAVGATYTTKEVRRVTLGVSGHLHAGHITTETESLQSAARLPARKLMFGPTVGGQLSVLPVTRVPLHLVASASVGLLSAVSSDQVLDGYTPYDNDAFRSTRLTLGVAWRRK